MTALDWETIDLSALDDEKLWDFLGSALAHPGSGASHSPIRLEKSEDLIYFDRENDLRSTKSDANVE